MKKGQRVSSHKPRRVRVAASVDATLGQSDDLSAFRTEVLDILNRKHPTLNAVPAEYGVIETDTWSIGLYNIYAAVGSLPAQERYAAIGAFLEQMVPIERSVQGRSLSWTEAKELVRPRLVPTDLAQVTPDLLHRPFSPGVIVGYVVDHGARMSFINRSEAEEWDVTASSVDETAVANLEALSVPVAVETFEPAHGAGLFTYIHTSDSYDAARLLLPEFRVRLLTALGDTAFVGIPNRDFLVAWSPDCGPFAKLVARVGHDFREEPYAITDTIFVIDRSSVRPATAAELRRR
jgi:hypothetical protein